MLGHKIGIETVETIFDDNYVCVKIYCTRCGKQEYLNRKLANWVHSKVKRMETDEVVKRYIRRKDWSN